MAGILSETPTSGNTCYNSNNQSQFLTSSINKGQNALNINYMLATTRLCFTPSLRAKSNEFFYKWISNRERYDQIIEIISFIKQNNKIPRSNDIQSFKVIWFKFFNKLFKTK